ncbi:endonuclease/exonuclease/phosphatase family protein [Blastococcus sp. SYSU D00669]
MRVLTLIPFGLGPDRSRRDARLAPGLAELAPDVVTLQEVAVADGRPITTASRWPVGRCGRRDVGPPPRRSGRCPSRRARAHLRAGNPHVAEDWPYRRIDHVRVRCGLHGGPTLRNTGCRPVFPTPETTVNDHYGVLADLEAPPPS